MDGEEERWSEKVWGVDIIKNKKNGTMII